MYNKSLSFSLSPLHCTLYSVHTLSAEITGCSLKSTESSGSGSMSTEFCFVNGEGDFTCTRGFFLYKKEEKISAFSS